MANFNLSNENGPCGLSRRMWILSGGIGLVILVIIIIIIAVSSSGGSTNRTGKSTLDDVPLIDGYNNLPQLLRKCAQNNLQKISFRTNLTGHTEWDKNCKTFTDLVRMEEGKLWGQVWYASAPCDIQYKDATPYILEQIDVIKGLHRDYSDKMQLVTSISDYKNTYSNKKISGFIGVDSGHVIDSRLGVLRMLYDLGVRFLTLSSCSGKDVTPWLINDRKELTAFGEEIVKEANRLGMVLDLTGIPAGVITQVVKMSDAPVIFSHVASKELMNNESNIETNAMREVKDHNGLIMLSFDRNLITKNETASLTFLLQHFDKIATEAGIDSIGIGSGFGLFEKSVVGMEDTSSYPKLFDALYEYKSPNKINWHSIENLQKVAFKNFERVLTEVEKVRDSKLTLEPSYKWIPNADLNVVIANHGEIKTCRSNYVGKKIQQNNITNSN